MRIIALGRVLSRHVVLRGDARGVYWCRWPPCPRLGRGFSRLSNMTQERTIPPEERRLVTVLFADLVGYTSVSEARDPELMQEALSLCFDRLAVEIRRFGGYVDKVVGDEIMALFGAPRAQEDDAGKAVAAALAMQRELEELAPQFQERLGQGLRMRVGINTGVVVTGAVGPGGYTVTGDAVNVAARLEKAADPGAVLVGEATRRLARRQFRWGDRQEFTVKGRMEPVVCCTVEELRAAPLRLVPAPSETPFVGRDEHLQQIHDVWEEAAGGSARVLQIVGEAGIGKTRMLAHFFGTAGTPPEQVLYTRADTPPRTFGPLLQLLPSLRENLPRGFQERVEALARAHEVAEAPEVEPDWLVDGLTEVIGALAANGPVALVLDDMQRADGATAEVVERLLPRLAALPVMTLLLRQPVGRRLRHLAMADSITLEPLSEQQARGLVLGAARGLPEGTASQIISRAGGNPLYLEILAAAAAAAPEGARIPESLQTAVVARVDELDETSRQVLREASVFGQSFYEEPLKLTTTVSEGLYDALAHLCDVGLLDEFPSVRNPGYQFRHSLVQQVLYEGLLRRQRAELHLRAAESLELVEEEGMEVEPEQLAYHFQEAGDSERAAAYYLAASERAERLRAPSEARSYRRAANRLLNMASLAGLYATNGRPTAAARAGAAALQALLGIALVLPIFVLFAAHRPEPNVLTLGLPFEIIDFNLSSVLLAVVLGGLPLMVAGIIFSHLAVPVLMRRRASLLTLVGTAVGGWLLGLLFVLIGYGALVGLLRINALDRLSSMYVGASTLRLLLGDYSMLVAAVIGTAVVAVAWTALLRLQARGWARLRRSSVGPRQMEEGRRWAALRQLGLLVAAAGALAAALLATYQFGVLPGGDMQVRLPSGAFAGLLSTFAAMAILGGAAGWLSTRRLRARSAAHQLGFFGFEVPLVLAIAFGLVAWFGMRQAVIVSANEVDTPGNLSAFNTVIDLFPDLSMARYLRGERYLADSDFENALADFNRAVELDAQFPATYLARGRVLIGLGDLAAAESDGSRLIELRPNHPAGYAIRAWAEAEQNDLAAASEDFNIATRPLPEDAQAWDAYFVRCLALSAVKQYDRAEPDCLRVLELNPDHIISLDQLALIAFDRGDYEKGIEYTTKILGIQSDNVQALVNRGTAYRLLNRYEEADADLSRAIELDPNNALAYENRAIARLYMDRPDDALADANRAVELDAGQLYVRLFVARYVGDNETAIADATRLLQLEESPTPYLLSSRGLSYLEIGELEQGLDDINQALEIDPEYAAGYDRRGYAYFLLGDYQRSEQDLDQALLRIATLPSESRAELHYHCALLHQAQGRIDAAIADLTEASKRVEVPSVRRAIEELQRSLEGQKS
jgi:class 3 adenylate cyclase/tetratricopeptide (TPR) repeat protein